MLTNFSLSGKVALITGGARRIGAATARVLHGAGMHLVIHYRNSEEAAVTLKAELDSARANSVLLVQGDLCDTNLPNVLIEQATKKFNRLDLLVNNASSFYPTPFGGTTSAQFDDLISTNLKAPFFLAQVAADTLTASRGAIINIADIWADRPLTSYPIYSAAKAGLVSLTRSLAQELAPAVRVNAIAPGAILWPENQDDKETQHKIITRIPLESMGDASDVAAAVLFFARDAKYITGQVLQVDGGRSILS